MNRIAFAAIIAALSGPALAQAQPQTQPQPSGFALVNGTGAPISQVSIRRAGSDDWQPLSVAPAPGSRAPVKLPQKDCAYDIRANVDGAGPVTWAGINLCDTKSVTLNRDATAGAWVDYDE